MSGSTPLLYHGTTTDHLDAILTAGLRRPSLTDDEGRAMYYAEESAEEDGGEPVVIAVTGLDPSRLLAHTAALSEPVMAGVPEDELWDRADAVVEELGVDGWSEIPWRRALELCGSVRHAGDVPPALLSAT